MAASPGQPLRPVPWRRLVAGAFLHFGVVAYVIVVPLASLLLVRTGADAAALLATGIHVSALFLLALAVTAAVAIGGAAMVDARADRRRRRSAAGDDAQSAQRIADALAIAERSLDPVAQAIVARLAAAAWRHDDPRDQALSRDLAQLVRTAAVAMASGSPERRALVADQTAAALRHLEHARADLEAVHATAAETDAAAAALYVERRYGPSDFAIKPD